jgi:hypothetical protein
VLTPASLARSPDRNAFPACSNPLSIEYAPWNRFQGQEKNESRCDSDFKDRGNRNERCASGNDADASGHEENSARAEPLGRPSSLLSRPHSLQTRDVFSLGLGEAEANLLESNCYPRHDIRH